MYLWVQTVSLDHLPQSARDEHVQQRAGDKHDEATFMNTCRDIRSHRSLLKHAGGISVRAAEVHSEETWTESSFSSSLLWEITFSCKHDGTIF